MSQTTNLCILHAGVYSNMAKGRRSFFVRRKNFERKRCANADKENRAPTDTVAVLPQSHVQCSAETVRALSCEKATSQQACSRGRGVVGDCSRQHPNSELEYIRDRLTSATLPAQWYNFATDTYRSVQLSKVESRAPQQPYVSCTITVHFDLSWEVIVQGKVVPTSCPVLREQSPYVHNADSLLQLMKLVDRASVCQGNSDADFIELCKQRGGQITSIPGHVSSYIASEPSPTVRHTDCEMLCSQGSHRCRSCRKYRSTLRSLRCKATQAKEHCEQRTAHDSHTNHCMPPCGW